MKLRVLGCHGGELPKHRCTCFLLDGALALDAGSLTSRLGLEELLAIDHVLVSHSHIDHVKDLPLLADLLVGRRETPVTVHASPQCASTLRKHLFNNAVWPDFTSIPSRAQPVLRIVPFEMYTPFPLGRYRVQPVPVSHPVESCGFIISDGDSTVGVSGDTGPTDAFWTALHGVRGLDAALVETSFPNALQELADISGHLTPNTVERELRKAKLKPSCEVLHYHLKPAFVGPLSRELRGLGMGGRILELDEELVF